MANKGANDVYQKLFMDWCSAQQVNRGTKAAFSYALKSRGEVPLDLLTDAIRENLTPLLFAEKLQDSGYDVTLVLSQLEAAELKDEEVKSEVGEENSVVIVPLSVASASKPKLVIQRADSTTETAAQSDMEGADFKADGSTEPKAGESAPTGEVNVAPKRLMRPSAPGVAKLSPAITEPEPNGPKAWINNVRSRFSGGDKPRNAVSEKKTEQSKSRSKTKNNSNKGFVLGIGIGVVAILMVLLFLSASLMSSQNFSPNVADAPLDSPELAPGGTSPVYIPTEAEMILELTEPMLKKPVSFEDFINNFPLRWLLWIGFLLPLFNQLKQDRFAAAEKTDLISIGIGILAMLLLTVTSGTISTLASSYLVTTQMSSYPADFQATAHNMIGGVIEALMVIMGVAFNLGMQLSASQSGKRDYSALAVGGFFSTGVILVWWYSGQSIIVSVGWILMFIGMYVQSKEMSKTYQGGGAIVVSFIMIAFFFLGFVVSSFAMKYVVQMNLPDIVAYFIYKSSLAVSVFFGGLISWSGGDYIATNILPPTKLADGSDGEDSSASIAELPVTVKYDAMSFGMMIMYPLVSVWWYVSALVSTFS